MRVIGFKKNYFQNISTLSESNQNPTNQYTITNKPNSEKKEILIIEFRWITQQQKTLPIINRFVFEIKQQQQQQKTMF